MSAFLNEFPLQTGFQDTEVPPNSARVVSQKKGHLLEQLLSGSRFTPVAGDLDEDPKEGFELIVTTP